jgi:hypothetical protein
MFAQLRLVKPPNALTTGAGSAAGSADRTGLIPFPTAVVAEHLGDAGAAARTASALYCGVLLGMSLAFGALFAWVTHTDRLLGRLPPPGVVGAAARRRFMAGLVVYGAALARSWVSAPLAVALCGLMALYYAFDQASVPAAAEPDDQPPTRRSAEIDDADPLAAGDGER